MAQRNRGCIENEIYVLGFVDDKGLPVDEVPDRFTARYMYMNEHTGLTGIDNASVGEIGVSGASLRDVLAWGFSTLEYKKMIEYEAGNGVPIQSEEELDELFHYSPGSAAQP